MLGAFFSHYILVGWAVGPYSYEDNFQQPFGLQQNLCILSWVPENNIFSMSSLRTCPLLTPLKRRTVPTLNIVNSQLAASQFSSVPSFTLCMCLHLGWPSCSWSWCQGSLAVSHNLHLAWSAKVPFSKCHVWDTANKQNSIRYLGL